MLAGLFRDGSGAPARPAAGGARRAAGASWCGPWCPARCGPPAWRPGSTAAPPPRGAALLRRGDAARPAGPGAVRAYKDAVVLEDGAGAGEASRTLALTAYPRTLLQAWLTPLVTLDAPVDLSVHVAPKEDARVRRALENRQARLQAVLNRAAQEGATPDPDVQVAVEDLARLRDALARRQERLFDVALYLRLRAPTRAALGTAREGLQARVQTAVSRLGADTRVLAYQQPQGFRAVLPEADRRGGRRAGPGHRQPGPHPAVRRRRTPAARASWWGSTGGRGRRCCSTCSTPAPERLPGGGGPGRQRQELPAQLLLLRHLLLGVEALVLDPEGQYRRLCAAVGGQLVRFAVSRGSHLNPFDLRRWRRTTRPASGATRWRSRRRPSGGCLSCCWSARRAP